MPDRRQPLISGNWKMHKNHLEGLQTIQKLTYLLTDDDYEAVDVSVHPPFTDLRTVQTAIESDRMKFALGAQNSDIARLVVSQGLGLAAAGVTLGGVVALIGARWIQPLLFRQSASDPTVFIVVGSTLALVAAAASAAPALRATRADPNTVLRTD